MGITPPGFQTQTHGICRNKTNIQDHVLWVLPPGISDSDPRHMPEKDEHLGPCIMGITPGIPLPVCIPPQIEPEPPDGRTRLARTALRGEIRSEHRVSNSFIYRPA